MNKAKMMSPVTIEVGANDCSLVIREDGSMELSMPNRPDDAEARPHEIKMAVLAVLATDENLLSSWARSLFGDATEVKS